MNKYNGMIISKYARILKNGDWCIIGNIARDGRWIKILDKDYLEIVEKLNKQDEAIYKEKKKILEALSEIKVLVEKSEEELDNNIKPVDITLELTTQCNLRCKHCSYGFGGKSYREMSMDMIISLSKWCEEQEVKRLLLTGGEIFCRTDIHKVISEIRQNFSGSLEVITNGTLINTSMQQEIVKNIDKLHISLDGYSEESVAEIRGKNIFTKVLELIDNLHNQEYVNITISCVDTGNSEKVIRFKKLAKDLGVRAIVRQLNLKGRALDNFSYEDTEHFYNHNLSKNGMTMKCLCNDQYKSLFINTNGDIFPCAALREDGYNIGSLSMNEKKISLKENLLIPIVDQIEECKSCYVKYFCSDTCISKNNMIYLNKEIIVKRCKIRKKMIMDSI